MKSTQAVRQGWIGSLLIHTAFLLTLMFAGRWSMESSTVLSLGGGGGGGPIEVELVGSLGNPSQPEPDEEIRAPREIRKFKPPEPAVPPEPDALPEPEPPETKRKTKQDERPVVAPNVRKKAKNGETPSEQTLRFGFGSGSGSGYGPGSGPGSGGGTETFPYQSWVQIVKTRIQANWRPLIAPVGERRTYQARVFFRLDRQGNLLEFKVIQSSGEPLFDQSIERAIRLAAPYPPLPYQYRGQTLAFDLTFRYTP